MELDRFQKNLYNYYYQKKLQKNNNFSRDEYKQSVMQQSLYVKNNKKFLGLLGDIRDKKRLNFAINENIDVVVHTAALKQVPATEYNPFETIETIY